MQARFSLATDDRILVVAPHPDDDVLGCGALLAAAAEGGVPVCVVYVTDGSRSHPGSRRFPAQRVRAIREREALAALAHCGIASSAATFLRVPDGQCESLAAHERTLVGVCLADILAAFRPTIVFAPWLRDPHPDHRAVARLVREVISQRPKGQGHRARRRYLEYPVWLAERGVASEVPRDDEGSRFAFWFDATLAQRKRIALAEHRSQTSGLIDDVPAPCRLSPAMLERACTSPETYFEPRDV